MKIADERETQKTATTTAKKQQQTKAEKSKGEQKL